MLGTSGYFIGDTNCRGALNNARQEFISLFDRVSQFHGFGPIISDVDVCRLYRERKPLWVVAYDQLRYMPAVYELALKVAPLVNQAGIAMPSIGAKIVVRADIPNDDNWNFPPHQDYPFNGGSLNSVTVWMPFQNCDIEHGALQIVPSSHIRGELPEKDNLLIDPPKECDYIDAPVRLGEALVFSQMLLHRSGYNRSNEVRFSIQLRFNDLASEEYLKRNLSIANNP